MRAKELPEATLRQRYLDEGRSAKEIAAEFGCSRQLVQLRLREYGIPTRHVSDYRRGKGGPGYGSWKGYDLDEARLRKLYLDEGLSAQAIGKLVGCSGALVSQRLAAAGIPRRHPGQYKRSGPTAPNWKGGRWETASGYVWVYAPDHPAARRGYVFEHRLVMEAKLGRYLEPDEIVHHMDHVTNNNDPDNLMLLTNADHTRLHHTKHHP